MKLNLRIKDLLKFQIYFLLIVETLVEILHFPGAIRIVLDVITICVLIFYFVKNKDRFVLRKDFDRRIEIYLVVYMVWLILQAIANLVPVGQIVWGIRNNFMYLIFFVLCIHYMSKKDINGLLDNVVKLQVVNFLCGLYQFFVLDVQNDNFGGMFGSEIGCNGYLNVYLTIITTYTMCKYIYKKGTTIGVVWVVGSSVLMATVAELKIFYVEIIVIVLCVVLFGRKKWKSVLIIAASVLALYVGIQVLATTSSDSMKYIVDIEEMLDYVSRTDFGNGDIRISRMTAIAQVNDYFFKDNQWLKLFGYGLGACEDSESFAWANSKFADLYREYQYRNLSVSMNYLETGFVGLIAFIMIFVFMFLYIQKYKRESKCESDELIYVFGQTVCVLCVVYICYNSTLRRELAYLVFAALSSAFIYIRHQEKCKE